MSKSDKLLGFILADGTRYWCGAKNGCWKKYGRLPPKVYGTKAQAQAAIERLKAKRWDVNGVTTQPIRCP